GIKWQMQGENTIQCRPLASVFNEADAVLGRKSCQNVECQHALAQRGRFSTALEIPRKPAPYFSYCLRLAALYLSVLFHYKGRLKKHISLFRRPPSKS
ncbi:hypothetical protein, partial [Neisseria sp. oral taxon 020]|uniref:hypothetical protein n=1 Tax=Neisseria sp. oral taxon 020 TaxID=712401 RepID=UPI001E4F2955